ncbi:M16 family metallopeptidase [Patescibacteria group bacterium]
MHKKKVLQNGLKILTVPIKNTKTATVLVMVKIGSKYEIKKNSGVSHFLEHLFFKGTKKRPTTLDIGKEFDQIGGEYNAFTSHEYTGFYAKVNSTHLNIALDVISDILLNSKFDQKEIDKEKGVIIEEINMYNDAPMQYVETLWNRCLYENQPAGWDILGTKDTVTGISRKDIVDYYKKNYTSKNVVVCVAGDVLGGASTSPLTKGGSRGVIEKYFKFPSSGTINKKLKVKISQTKPEILFHHKKTDQTHLMLGVRGYDMFNKDRFALKLLSIILGSGMSSRLFTEIREKRGLAYYVYTTTDNDTDTGYLVTGAGLDNSKVDEAIKVILGEYKNIKQSGVSAEELKKAKEYYKGKTVLSMESSDAWASFYTAQELLRDKTFELDDIFAKIDKVSLSDIKRVAKDVFVNKKLNLALIGPGKVSGLNF